MKKSLVALAALAVVGVASAQSSVTMYGVADVAVMKSSGVKAGGRANGTYNNGNSRLGVRGNEDLGGGLKAFFNFEQAVDLGNGATDANTWQRAAYMGLGGNFGEVYAGRRLTPNFNAVATYELTGMANYSAVVNQFGVGGDTRATAFTPVNGILTQAITTNVRLNAHAGYTTPSFGGFSATLGGQLASNSPDNRDTLMANLNYKQGPIAAALGYYKTENSNRSLSLGGSYDFGMAKVAVGFYDPSFLNKGFSIGASMPLGPVVLTLDVAHATEGTKDTDILLEAKYALSKRTFAYGIAYRVEDGRAGATRAHTNTFGMGVRHNF